MNRQVGPSNLLRVDRSKLFDPNTLFGEEGRYWSLSSDDERSVALTEVDNSKVHLMRRENPPMYDSPDHAECASWGVVWWRSLLEKRGQIPLDVRFLAAFLENPHLIPEVWKEKIEGRMVDIFFDGTIMTMNHEHEFLPCLYYWRTGEWHIGYNFASAFGGHDPAALSAVFVP